MAGLRKYPADNDCSVAEPAGFRQLNLSPGLVESLFDTACSADRTKVDRVPQTGLLWSKQAVCIVVNCDKGGLADRTHFTDLAVFADMVFADNILLWVPEVLGFPRFLGTCGFWVSEVFAILITGYMTVPIVNILYVLV